MKIYLQNTKATVIILPRKTIKFIVSTLRNHNALTEGNTSVLFIDVQAESLTIGHGLFVEAFEACETLKSIFYSAGTPCKWVISSQTALPVKTTAGKFCTQRHRAEEDFQIVEPAPGDTVYIKNRRDAFTNSHFARAMTQNPPENLFLCGFFSEACLGDTARSILKHCPQTHITFVTDATDLSLTDDPGTYIKTFPKAHQNRVSFCDSAYLVNS